MFLLVLVALAFTAVWEWVFVREARRSTTRRGKAARCLLAAIPPVLWLVVVLAPNFMGTRSSYECSACVRNLKQLDGAKATWALEGRHKEWETPLDADLFGPDKYMRQRPVCYEGGTYRIGTVAENSTCSLGGLNHSLPKTLGL